MSPLGTHDYFGRALVVSVAVHGLVALSVFIRPLWQDSPAWQLPDSIDIGVVNAGDIPNLGGGSAAHGAKQMAQAAPVPKPAEASEPAALEPEPSEAEDVPPDMEPETVSLAAAPAAKTPAKPKPAPVAKPAQAAKPKTALTPKVKPITTAKPVVPTKPSGSGASESLGTDAAAPAASASSALNSVLAKYQKPGGRGDGGGPGDHASGRDGTASAGIASNFYQRTLVARIRQFWNVPPGVEAEGLSTVFALTISREGTLESANLVKSSGDRLFDASAEKAVQAAAPYGPVPQSIRAPFRVEVRLIPENKN